ncbi:hypothetical protein [Escherichia coli]|uniref:hypothetical protein n=1 Tax=Escherichia coli TaxID=562 RepID=UPI00111499A2|nr:hypothetical protein [Escherichia coli]
MEGKILDNRSVLTYYKHIGRGWSPTTKAAQRQEHENAFHNFSKKTFRYRKRFSVVRVTLCTICLKHEKTGEAYVVIFTDCHNIRDYKKGVVPVLGELYQEDVDLITGKS